MAMTLRERWKRDTPLFLWRTFRSYRPLAIVFPFALCNAIAFSVVTDRFGGTAWGGRIEGNSYFVGNHGHFLKVSQSAFERLHYWESVTIALGVLSFPCAVVFMANYRQWNQQRNSE